MAKIGKVKAETEQTEDGKLLLTVEEVDELAQHLEDAKSAAEEATNEKSQGLVSLEVQDDKITVATSKVKKEKEEDDDDK